MNSYGTIFRLTSFGESHGPAMGGVIDGMPAGVKIDLDEVQMMVDRRRPGTGETVTRRKEPDRVEFLSGILDGVTLGTPIGFIIRNTDSHPQDYEQLRHVFRPSHADYTFQTKYGVRDFRGGGRASARETVSRVVAGALAVQVLRGMGVSISSRIVSVGDFKLTDPVADLEHAREMIRAACANGDSLGGVVECTVEGNITGIGEPVFGKLQARLADAMMSIPAAKGFEYGMGFEGVSRLGSEMLDEFITDGDGHITTATNHSGGIQGGIANGAPIVMRVAFKPVASIARKVRTVNDSGEPVELLTRGRHDPCVVERAIPVVEAMAAMTILDMVLINRCSRI